MENTVLQKLNISLLPKIHGMIAYSALYGDKISLHY
jgi:hypothetical protein